MKKIVALNELKKIIPSISQKKIVLIGGCFDILHFGHLTFLKKAKEVGNFLVVALESDVFIKKYKKRQPVHNQNQRAEILSSIKFVDLVIKLPLFKFEKQYYELVEIIKPSIIATTKGDKQVKNKKNQAEMIGAKLKVVSSLLESFSTKKIINVLRLEL